MSRIFAAHYVSLDRHPWLDGLRGAGMAWQGAAPLQDILLVATEEEEVREWAAYYQLPHLEPDLWSVKDHGAKLPEDVARDIFGNVPYTYRK